MPGITPELAEAYGWEWRDEQWRAPKRLEQMKAPKHGLRERPSKVWAVVWPQEGLWKPYWNEKRWSELRRKAGKRDYGQQIAAKPRFFVGEIDWWQYFTEKEYREKT